MAYTYTWDTTSPVGTDLVSDGQRVIREDVKGALNERLLTVFTNMTSDPLVHSKVLLAALGFIHLDGSVAGDTYIYERAANAARLTVGGLTAFDASAGLFQIGSSMDLVLQPTKKLYMDGGGDTYIHEQSANVLSAVVGGQTVLTLGSNAMVVKAGNPIYFDGVGGAAGDTYIFEGAANDLRIIVGGSVLGYFALGATPTVYFGTGSLGIGAANRFYLDGGGDTYIVEGAANRMELWAGGAEMFRIQNGTINSFAVSFQLQATNKLYLDGGTDTYIHESIANLVQVVTGAAARLNISSAGIQVLTTDIIVASGAAVRLDGLTGAGGGDTYIYESAANTMTFVVGTAVAASFNTGTWGFGSGIDVNITALKRFYFDGGVDTYIFESAANNLRFVAGTVTMMNISSTLVDLAPTAATNLSLGGASSNIGFFGAAATAKKTITGSRGGNAALADLLTDLAAYGLITDSTSA